MALFQPEPNSTATMMLKDLICFTTLIMTISRAFADIYTCDYDVTYGCDLTYGHVLETFDNIGSITECCWLCDGIEHCVSVKYDTVNTACQLNSYRSLTVNQSCPVMVEYATLTKSSGLGLINEDCDVSAECSVPNSRCSLNKCQCKPGYSYKYANESCVTSCDSYGITFTYDPGYGLRSNNDKNVVDVYTAEACMQLCVDETSFECRSCEFLPGAQHCHMSKDTALTKPSFYETFTGGMEYYHRNCQ